MTDEVARWRRVKEVLQSAIERPREDRPRFLREACRDDETLRAEVESLLLAHERAGRLAERPALDALALETDDPGQADSGYATLRPGTQLGPYVLDARIGAGGMGEVYRARDTRLDRLVAVKVPSAALQADPAFRQRFEREARTLASVGHPNICAVFDVGRQDGVDYFVMEYFEGETLAARVRRGALDMREALHIARQIASALEAAHRAGIVHRDLKPGNVMLARPGGQGRDVVRAKLLDFGLGRASGPAPSAVDAAGQTGQPGLTTEGTLIGTCDYMAPEQIEGRTADARSDIFAFGIVLYEMLAARRPFAGATPTAVFGAILKDDPPPVSTLRPGTPALLDHLVRRCLAKDPDDRWQTAGDLVSALKWIAERPAESQPGSFEDPRHLLLRPGAPRTFAAVAGAIALVMLGALAAVGLASRMRSPESPPEMVVFHITTPPTAHFTSMAISPDRRTVAFVASVDKVSRLWLRPMDSEKMRPLAGTEGARFPFWSPDSRYIGFFAHGKLKTVDVISGTVEKLADAPDAFGGTWSQNDLILYMPMAGFPLQRIHAQSGRATTEPLSADGDRRFPQFLPDGRHYLYYGTGTEPGIYVGELGTSQSDLLLEADAAVYGGDGYLYFVRQGTLYAQAFDSSRLLPTGPRHTLAQQIATTNTLGAAPLSVANDGTILYRLGGAQHEYQLVWFDRTGTPEPLPLPWEGGITLSLSPDDGTVVFAAVLDGSTDISSLDLERGGRQPVTHDAGFDLGPIWSPREGDRIAYTSGPNGHEFDLFVMSMTRSAEQPTGTPLPGNQNLHDWSPDEKYLLYGQRSETGIDLMALSTADGKSFPVVQSGFVNANAQFSPRDGQWIAFQSNASGSNEIYLAQFPTPGRRHRISPDGGVQPRWSHDGTELFYLAPDDTLMRVPIERLDTATDTVQAGNAVSLSFRLPLDGSSQALYRRHYAVSKDSRRFLVDTALEVTLPITVLLNWRPAP